VLSALADTGLSVREQHEAFLALIGRVRSHAEFLALHAESPSAKRWASVMMVLFETHRYRYPALADAINSGAFRPSKKKVTAWIRVRTGSTLKYCFHARSQQFGFSLSGVFALAMSCENRHSGTDLV